MYYIWDYFPCVYTRSAQDYGMYQVYQVNILNVLTYKKSGYSKQVLTYIDGLRK